MSLSAADATIRATTAADVPGLLEFIHPFVEQGKLLPRTEEELGILVPHGFVAELGERIIGVAALEIYSIKLAEIRSLAVAAEYQGQGIGKRLIEACLRLARERNVLEVMAITSSENVFRACGFDYTLPGEKKALFFQTR
ncbi:MAG: GNAT family N-acetyltransferase [Planctomycetaceae bacterium]